MSTNEIHLPAGLPLLSRGKHRSPRKGACFMELASVLAGEKWSDHPVCTHPLLAALARQVNDYTSDAGRQRLARLIPSVIGMTGDDAHLDARIALRCATTALPIVSAERQRVMAVAVLAADRVLAELDHRPAAPLEEASARALAEVPDAARWAERFAGGMELSTTGFVRRSAPSIVRHAVAGIALACVSDPDGMLHDLLVAVVDDCTALLEPAEVAQPAAVAQPVPAPAHG